MSRRIGEAFALYALGRALIGRPYRPNAIRIGGARFYHCYIEDETGKRTPFAGRSS